MKADMTQATFVEAGSPEAGFKTNAELSDEVQTLTNAMRAMVSRIVMLERVCETLISDVNALKAPLIRARPFNG